MFKKAALIIAFMLLSTGFSFIDEAGGKEKSRDHGKQPWIVDIQDLTLKNKNYRTTHWTGKKLQMTTMTIKPGGEVGLEKHDQGDQFIRIEEGDGRVVMSKSRDKMTFNKKVSNDWAIFIPEGYWHNIINEGKIPLKFYVIYAPPTHSAGTVHRTIEESESAHDH